MKLCMFFYQHLPDLFYRNKNILFCNIRLFVFNFFVIFVPAKKSKGRRAQSRGQEQTLGPEP